MTVAKLFELNLHDDRTTIEVFLDEGNLTRIIRGKWYEDYILACADRPVKEFTWKEGGKLRIKLKEEVEV